MTDGSKKSVPGLGYIKNAVSVLDEEGSDDTEWTIRTLQQVAVYAMCSCRRVLGDSDFDYDEVVRELKTTQQAVEDFELTVETQDSYEWEAKP
jgi:hypothetical protein